MQNSSNIYFRQLLSGRDFAVGNRAAEQMVNFVYLLGDKETGECVVIDPAYAVDDIYATCTRLQAGGVTISRPPRDGRMAFVRSPDGISIELLQAGPALAPAEPWASMPNVGAW